MPSLCILFLDKPVFISVWKQKNNMLIWPRNYAALYFNSLAFIILGYTRLSGVTIGLVTGIIGGVEYIRIGHPWFACAHFSTMITPILLALLVDGAAHLVDRKSKVKRHEWSSWRHVYIQK